MENKPHGAPRRTKTSSPIAINRMKAGLTQSQLADAIGVKPQQIGNWERGIRNPKLDALKRISDALECKVEDLII